MHIYDSLIIGSGYYSAGYAISRKNCVICEEHQVCDTSFYLPMRSFAYAPYTPKTEEGSALLRIFHSLPLFNSGYQNTNCFEFAFCKYITKSPLKILLKCRVVSAKKQPDGIYDVTIQTNEGISHLFARNILNTANTADCKFYTVLFVSENIEGDRSKLLSAFSAATVEPAFYKDRYALHIPVSDQDENSVKVEVYNKWKMLNIGAKILYMAPVFYGDKTDDQYKNPIEAFEAGYFSGKEQTK